MGKPNRLRGSIVWKAALAVTGIAIAAAAVGSQGKPRPAFEVSSIKPLDVSKMSRGHEGHQLDRERFVDRTEPLQYIVRAYLAGTTCVMTATPAFGHSCPLISGPVPEWLKTESYEIQAKMPANSVPSYTPQQLRLEDTPELNLMLQVLLEDRFHLKVHWETKQLPVYLLTVGKNGPRLKKSVPRDEIFGLSGLSAVPTLDGSRRTRMNFQASSLEEAARTFSFYFDRQVLDRTGLKADYDFVVEYEDDPTARVPGNPFSGLAPSALSASLQTLGLRLTKASVKVLVIDHVEKPSPN
jgi:uncharacterized protein (TIGR03435 family)